MPQTRRQFLTSVGVTGGAGVLYGTMGALGLAPAAAETPPYVPPRSDELRGRRGPSVVMLGGGIAGLTAAYELGKAGYKVTVLEARQRPGGRNWSIRGGTSETDLQGRTQHARFSRGEYMNAGPARIPQHHLTLEYCRELGVAIEPFVNQNADGYLIRDGDHALAGTPVRHRAAKADVYGYVSELLAKATDQGALDRQLTTSDKEALISFLRNFGAIGPKVDGDPAGSYRYTGTGRRGYEVPPGAGIKAGTPLPPYELSDVLASGVGNYFSFEFGWDQAMMMFQPVGGMDRIPYAFEKAIGKDKIRYGAEIRGMRNTAGGVEVDHTNPGGQVETLEADFAICALPPHLSARIPSNLPSDIVSALRYTRATDSGKIGLEYGRRWWELDHRIYGGITNGTELSNVWYPSHGFHGERGTVIGYYNTGSNARTYGELTPAQRRDRALNRLTEIHGGAAGKDLAASFSVYWTDVRYTEGAWVHWDSRTDGTYAELLEPTGNIYFAGDHLSHAIAWQHGAMVSARNAVTQLHSRVTSP